ncbi:MAG: hypothetical protein A3E82_08080 [Gammaproteobacteria bacterium RIFCSPHIGHO2_12_FULL_38_11]|nr:MAG: hypothetical protein A3E82_08080 [Gammaproteobacteria bacterium RIFCSPHIGHO2_12_FULL_38_11]
MKSNDKPVATTNLFDADYAKVGLTHNELQGFVTTLESGLTPTFKQKIGDLFATSAEYWSGFSKIEENLILEANRFFALLMLQEIFQENPANLNDSVAKVMAIPRAYKKIESIYPNIAKKLNNNFTLCRSGYLEDFMLLTMEKSYLRVQESQQAKLANEASSALLQANQRATVEATETSQRKNIEDQALQKCAKPVWIMKMHTMDSDTEYDLDSSDEREEDGLGEWRTSDRTNIAARIDKPFEQALSDYADHPNLKQVEWLVLKNNPQMAFEKFSAEKVTELFSLDNSVLDFFARRAMSGSRTYDYLKSAFEKMATPEAAFELYHLIEKKIALLDESSSRAEKTCALNTAFYNRFKADENFDLIFKGFAFNLINQYEPANCVDPIAIEFRDKFKEHLFSSLNEAESPAVFSKLLFNEFCDAFKSFKPSEAKQVDFLMMHFKLLITFLQLSGLASADFTRSFEQLLHELYMLRAYCVSGLNNQHTEKLYSETLTTIQSENTKILLNITIIDYASPESFSLEEKNAFDQFKDDLLKNLKNKTPEVFCKEFSDVLLEKFLANGDLTNLLQHQVMLCELCCELAGLEEPEITRVLRDAAEVERLGIELYTEKEPTATHPQSSVTSTGLFARYRDPTTGTQEEAQPNDGNRPGKK